MIEILTVLIVSFGFFNLLRLSIFMIAADVYDFKNYREFKGFRHKKLPLFTILIPAYNEEACIDRTVKSVISAKYPRKEIVIINDGSTDGTADHINALIRRYNRSNLRLINQINSGKGSALNNGIRQTSGELVMVLDADSSIDKYALKNAIKYFDDKRVKGVAASVRLEKNRSCLGLLQRVEYLLSYRMKRSLTALNIEYIIGGVGSIYRRSTLVQVFGYRTNTITEDIDLSMKVIARGNKAYRVVFASDVKTSTQPVLTLKELIKQRYRWKLGRFQAFVRYRHLFLTTNKKYGKMLCWFQFPYALFGEFYLILEPIFIATIILVSFMYGDATSIFCAFIVMSIFMALNFLITEDESAKNKFVLILLTPLVYILMPLLSYVELVSLIKTAKNWRKLSPKSKALGHWIPVKRVQAN